MTEHNPRPATVLIGLRGSGKTTLGRLLAARRAVPFIDLDERTIAGSGHASVSAMFRAEGEHAFRAAESRALASLLSDPSAAGSVIALGGGTPTAPGARALLEAARASGTVKVVLLDAPPAVLGARLSVSPGDRPLLMGANFAEEAELLGGRRLPGYRELADAVVPTGGGVEAALAQLQEIRSW